MRQNWVVLFSGLLIFSSLHAEECGEIAFEEDAVIEEKCEGRHCRHYYHPEPSIEEEHLWQERADSSWAGKRDDNFIDFFLHQ